MTITQIGSMLLICLFVWYTAYLPICIQLLTLEVHNLYKPPTCLFSKTSGVPAVSILGLKVTQQRSPAHTVLALCTLRKREVIVLQCSMCCAISTVCTKIKGRYGQVPSCLLQILKREKWRTPGMNSISTASSQPRR